MKLFDVLEKKYPGRVKREEPLAQYTTIKVGGKAEVFFEARGVDELVDSINLARESGVAYFVLGGGTNILIGDKGVDGLVVRNKSSSIVPRSIRGPRSARTIYLEVDSGVVFNTLVRTTIDRGLAGLEMHMGLPGTVGGAIYMNSKWTNPVGYVGDVVHSATVLGRDGRVRVEPRSYFRFGYDTSIIQKTGEHVISVVFALREDNAERLAAVARESMEYRRKTQPQGVFSMGCTFRNISASTAVMLSTPNHTTSAGFLLDYAGLKGLIGGGAQISPVHANFIINTGNATAKDICGLIEIARAKVKEQFGVTLVEEIVRIGKF